MEAFDAALEGLDGVDPTLRTLFRHQAVRASGLYHSNFARAWLFDFAIRAATVIGLIAVPIGLLAATETGATGLVRPSGVLAPALALSVILAVILMAETVFFMAGVLGLPRARLLTGSLVAGFCLSTFVLIVSLSAPVGLFEYSIAAGLGVFFVFHMGTRLMMAFRSTWYFSRSRSVQRRMPEAFVSAGLVETLHLVRNRAQRRATPSAWMNEAIRNVDRAAAVLDVHLPYRSLEYRDEAIQEALTEDLRKAAGQVRSIGVEITRYEEPDEKSLVERLHRLIGLSVRGRWHAISNLDSDPLPYVAPPSTDKARWLRVGLASLVPLALLAVVEILVGIDGSVAAYSWLAAVVWAAVGFVSLIDPRSIDRIEAIKDSGLSLSFKSEQ